MFKYINDFIKGNDGVETIEFIGVLAVGAGLIAAIASVASGMNDKVSGAKSSISKSIDEALEQAK